MKIFVAWDFTLRGGLKKGPAQQIKLPSQLDGVQRLAREVNGDPIEWNMGGVTDTGEIPRGVENSIKDSDKVLGIMDLPNANVGWEIGLALGFGKHIWLAYVGGADKPDWLQREPLSHLVSSRIENAKSIRDLLSNPDSPSVPPPRKAI